MELKRNLETKQIYIVDNNQILLETDHIGGEFIILLYTNKPIIITKELDEYIYMNLNQILENEYIFNNNNLSYKKDNIIVWFSDQYCDIENKEETDKINRLIIEKKNNQIQISYDNPFFKQYGINRTSNCIAFSPCGNGFFSKNLNTGLTFQDDIVWAFYKTLICKYDNNKNKKVLNRKK